MLALALWTLAGCSGEPSGVPSECAVVLHPEGDTIRVDGGTCAQATLTARVVGAGSLALSWRQDELDELTPVVSGGETGATLQAVVLEGEWALAGSEPARWWRQGYQSWSWSGVTEGEEPELVDGLPRVGGDGDSVSVVEETAPTSWWAASLGRPDGASLHVGALAATTTKVWMAASPTTAWVVWGGRGESIALAPGEERTLDPVRWGAGENAEDLWEEWAASVAATPRGIDRAPPTGWSDWYTFYGATTEDDIRGNLAAAGDLDVVQVDDGWEVAWGDWTANERFPSGMAALAADIRAAGKTPGLWMAPFYVARSTATFAAHDDWWVRDADGEILDSASCDCAVIDVTNPDAAAWMAQQVADRVAEGWAYLKLDFLYAGALEGRRAQPVTGMEAYRLGISLLRQAAGDAWILGCGAPMLPSVGFVESWRSGADIAFVQLPDPDPAFVRWQARSTAARAFANGRWWWNDADNLLLRDPLTDDEVRGAVAAQVASGGSWFLGDDLRTLSPDRLALATDPALLALRGQPSRPADPLDFPSGVDGAPFFEAANPDDAVPTRWTLAGGATVLLNLSDAEVTVDGPGGAELLTGASASAGPRTLPPGGGEVWAP